MDKLYLDRSLDGSFIFLLYPEVLDFTKKDLLIVEYAIENPKSLTGITFNENEKDLDCQDVGREIKRCIVPKSHFKGKNGTYFLNTKNSFGKYVKIYELFPYQVIIPEDNQENSSQINKGSIALILLLCLGLL